MMEVPCAWRRNKYKKLKQIIMSTTTSQYNGTTVIVLVLVLFQEVLVLFQEVV